MGDGSFFRTQTHSLCYKRDAHSCCYLTCVPRGISVSRVARTTESPLPRENHAVRFNTTNCCGFQIRDDDYLFTHQCFGFIVFSNSSDQLSCFSAEVYLQFEKSVSPFNRFGTEDTRHPQIQFLEVSKREQDLMFPLLSSVWVELTSFGCGCFCFLTSARGKIGSPLLTVRPTGKRPHAATVSNSAKPICS